MSREIKFRLYSKLAKKYIDYITIGFSKTGELRNYSTENGVGPVLEKNYIVEQYTGLTDKNGKEIYEGDIVANGTLTGVVEYKVDDFCAWTVGTTTNGVVLLSGSWTVIGNIHENPELLGVKND